MVAFTGPGPRVVKLCGAYLAFAPGYWSLSASRLSCGVYIIGRARFGLWETLKTWRIGRVVLFGRVS